VISISKKLVLLNAQSGSKNLLKKVKKFEGIEEAYIFAMKNIIET